MRKPLIFFMLLVLAAAGVAASPSSKFIRRLDGTRIKVVDADSFAQKTLAEHGVTGAEIAVLDRGRVVWSAAFGTRRVESDGARLSMTPETNTWAASITKSVFSTYVMGLVQQGRFDLDTPVAQQLAQPLDSYEAYREKGSALVKDPAWPLVTPRMLLSHSSGLANFAYLEPDKKMRLRFKPGSQFLYSGEGINLVQFAVEQKMGKPIEELMQEAFFTPLGMTQTGLIYRKEFEANIADRFDEDGKFHAQTRRFPARAAGSMSTSAEDLGRFVSALFAGKILNRKTMDAMLTPVYPIRTGHEFPLTADEHDTKEAEAVGLAYGVGWGLLTKTKYGPAFFKEGHGDGAQNYMICFQQRQACMILLTNSDNGELAFRPLLEKIFGDDVTPWEWEGYTPAFIEASRKVQ